MCKRVLLFVFSFLGFVAVDLQIYAQGFNVYPKAVLTSLSPYRPNYLLPFYYSSKPLQLAAPNKTKVEKKEINFQISMKALLFAKLFGSNTNFYLAYSQLSFWQEYAKVGFVRDTNYEPELFFSYKFDPLLQQKYLRFFKLGYDHDSNGRGTSLERSWERLYVDMVFGTQNFLFSIKPWIRISGVLENHNYNSNITKYLGHGRFLFAYKCRGNVFSLMSRNNIESLFKRGAIELTWGFPIYKYLRGFVKYFSGYGQNLIEYNHYNNSFGVGLSMSDWL